MEGGDLKGTDQWTIKKKQCLLTYHTGAIELKYEDMQINGRREGKWRWWEYEDKSRS